MPVYKLKQDARGIARAMPTAAQNIRPAPEVERQRYFEEKRELREGSAALAQQAAEEPAAEDGGTGEELGPSAEAKSGEWLGVAVQEPAASQPAPVVPPPAHVCPEPGCGFMAATSRGLQTHMRAKHGR